jgi:universal stress protein A
MSLYNNILLAVELNEAGDREPTQKALELTKQFGSHLFLVHAIEHISSYGAAYGVAVGADIEEMLQENAKEKMREFAKTLDVREQDQIIKFGPAKIVILEEAERIKEDLIIIGSHGRHGIRLLLGSTANAVLHGAMCDVLAVRLKE